jgi:hypothetical protein
MSPAYGTLGNVPAIFPFPPGHTFLAFNAEAVLAGEYSQQVALPPGPTAGAKGIRVVIDASAAPGAGEFYVMEGDNDPAGSADYVQVPSGGDLAFGNITAGPNGAGTRWTSDLIPVAGQFVCLYCKTAPSNAGIKITARITRAA